MKVDTKLASRCVDIVLHIDGQDGNVIVLAGEALAGIKQLAKEIREFDERMKAA